MRIDRMVGLACQTPLRGLHVDLHIHRPDVKDNKNDEPIMVMSFERIVNTRLRF